MTPSGYSAIPHTTAPSPWLTFCSFRTSSSSAVERALASLPNSFIAACSGLPVGFPSTVSGMRYSLNTVGSNRD